MELTVITPEGTIFSGESKREIINQMFKWSFNEHNQLVHQRKGYVEQISSQSWSKEYGKLELEYEAVSYLWGKLFHYKCRVLQPYKG